MLWGLGIRGYTESLAEHSGSVGRALDWGSKGCSLLV